MATGKNDQTPAQESTYVSLHSWAHANVPQPYSVELMGGFYHEQETKNHFADTEENWHSLMKQFANREVK